MNQTRGNQSTNHDGRLHDSLKDQKHSWRIQQCSRAFTMPFKLTQRSCLICEKIGNFIYLVSRPLLPFNSKTLAVSEAFKGAEDTSKLRRYQGKIFCSRLSFFRLLQFPFVLFLFFAFQRLFYLMCTSFLISLRFYLFLLCLIGF